MKSTGYLLPLAAALSLAACGGATQAPAPRVYTPARPDTVEFRSGDLTLHGVLWKPEGKGPFPAVIFNHGSSQSYDKELAAVGPFYASHGYVLFWPFRRGQGLSANAGEPIMQTVNRLSATGEPRGPLLAKLLWTEQLSDQLAGLQWLLAQNDVDTSRVAAAGNSFGGILAVFMAARAPVIKAVVASAPAAQTWAVMVPVREKMIEAARSARVPVFFFQAENDYDLSPSRVLSAEMTAANKPNQAKIYPAFGTTAAEGHSFGYFGGATWGPDVFAFLTNSFKAK